jgi:Fe-S cluster biogenesis protein NfuA
MGMICVMEQNLRSCHTTCSVYNEKIQGGIMLEKVQAALDQIRPMLKRDGGDAQLIEVTPDGVVKLKLVGACGHCPMSQMTLKMGIEKRLKEQIPEVKEVISV